MLKVLLGLSLLTMLSLGHAQATKSQVGHEVARTAADVSNAFSRREAQYAAGSLDQVALPVGAADLFPGYGFVPRANQVSWSLKVVTEDIVTLCTVTRIGNVQEWAGFLHAATKAGLAAATTDCQAMDSWGTPAQFPVQIGARRNLDRRQVPLPTVVPEGVSITAQAASTWYPVVSSSVAVNAVLQAHPGQPSSVWKLKVVNLGTQLLKFSAGMGTPGLAVVPEAASCEAIAANDACYLNVTYTPTLSQTSAAGRIRGQFKAVDVEGQALGPQLEVSVTVFGETLQ